MNPASADTAVSTTLDPAPIASKPQSVYGGGLTHTYTLDLAGNRLQTVYGGTSRTITGYSDGTRSVSLGYDYDGNRTSRSVTGGSDNGTDTYGYDLVGNVLSVAETYRRSK